MDTGSLPDTEDTREYIVIPEEAIPLLPMEWRQEILAMRDDGHAILEAVDGDIKNLIRLANAFPAMASLHYIQRRLSRAEFVPTTEAILEHEMLTLAFVVSYVRVTDGSQGSGVSRSALPAHLREAHDEIIALRNRRFAHNAGHDSVEGALEIGFENGKFDVNISVQLGYYVRGADAWGELVDFINRLLFDRLQKQLERLREKTGREWTFPSGSPPEWA